MRERPNLIGQDVYYCEESKIFPASIVKQYSNGLVDLTVYQGEVVSRERVRWGSGDGRWAWRPEDL